MTEGKINFRVMLDLIKYYMLRRIRIKYSFLNIIAVILYKVICNPLERIIHLRKLQIDNEKYLLFQQGE